MASANYLRKSVFEFPEYVSMNRSVIDVNIGGGDQEVP